MLRLVNPGADPANESIEGLADRDPAPRGPVRLSLEGGAARETTSGELESGADGLTGALGDGEGKWRLTVESDRTLLVMSLLENPTGHVTNLSTVPESVAGEGALVPLFPLASGRQGFVRVVNRSSQAGEATITARDDAGRSSGRCR